MQDEDDEDDGEDYEYLPERDWLDGLGAGAMAVIGTAAFALAILFMALSNQIGGARTGEAASLAEDAAFEAPAPRIARSQPRAGDPAWLRHAAPFAASPDTPLVAVIVLDDGTATGAAMGALDWSAPLTFAVAADFDDSPHTVQRIRRAEREALAILPFGYGPAFGRDPNVIRRGLPEGELLRRVRWHLARAGDGIVGAVDARAGDIVRDIAALRTVGEALAGEGLLMIDSRSDPDGLVGARLRPMGIPVGRRTVHIRRDALPDEAFAALTDAERHAFTWGTAIVLVEAAGATMETLSEWLRTKGDSVAVAPVSHVVRRLRKGPQHAGR